jgi:hypothetical protein
MELDAGGPTISEGSDERGATALTGLDAGGGATFATLGEGCGFTTADDSKGDRVAGVAFGTAILIGLGLPVGILRPLLGAEPEKVLAVAFG